MHYLCLKRGHCGRTISPFAINIALYVLSPHYNYSSALPELRPTSQLDARNKCSLSGERERQKTTDQPSALPFAGWLSTGRGSQCISCRRRAACQILLNHRLGAWDASQRITMHRGVEEGGGRWMGGRAVWSNCAGVAFALRFMCGT